MFRKDHSGLYTEKRNRCGKEKWEHQLIGYYNNFGEE